MNKMPKTNTEAKFDFDSVPMTFVETIQRLEREKEELRHELWKYKRKPTGTIGYLLLFFGMITLIFSIIYVSYIPAFIGISLTFWGGLLLFIKPTKYIKACLLKPTILSTFTNINKIIANMNYKGNGIYLPPQYSKESKGGIVFIPIKEENTIPPLEEITQEKVFVEYPKGICLTPSGLALTNMFEEELGIDFTESTLEYLQEDLQKLFSDGLEIAENYEMENRENNIHIIISDSIFNDFCSEARKLTKNACQSFACPLCSSIACALTRVTGKPVIIQKNSVSADNKTMHVYYQILGTVEKVTLGTIEKVTPLSRPTKMRTEYSLTTITRIIPPILGSIILAFVFWLTLYDLIVWNKDLVFIFFGSRTGEAITLGIGMRVIHYFLLGLVVWIPTILLRARKFFRERTLHHVAD